MAGLDIEIIGDGRDLQRALLQLDAAGSYQGMVSFLGGVADPYLRKRIKDRFAKEGDDVTGSWAPLREATVAFRESQGFPGRHPINKRTGKLEQFLTGNRGAISFNQEFTTLTLPGSSPTGEMVDKLKTAQRGGMGRRKSGRPAPARPVLGMNENDLLFVTTELAFFIERAVKA